MAFNHFFATVDDGGLVVRGAKRLADLPSPNEWIEVSDIISTHVNESGLYRLRSGLDMVFTPRDKSYAALASGFYAD